MNCLRRYVLQLAAFSCLTTLHAQNDIRAIVNEVLTPSSISDGASITYFIRFQNIGADTVFQVIIRDTLDPRLDANTFAMLDSSHAFQLVRDGSNVIRWYFDDIFLPDSASGGINSIGYVLFTVQPKPFLAPGQTILNRACTTFDQVASVCTNDAIIRIEYDPADVDEPGKEFTLRIIPNPNYGQFEVRSATTEVVTNETPTAEWWITDITGKIVWDGRATDIVAASNQVLLERPSPGLYLLWVKDASRLQVEEFAVIR